MIRILTPNDTEIYRQLRLLSLKTDPLAFLSTYDVETKYDLSYFRQKIFNSIKHPLYGIYGLFDKDKLVAFAQLADSYYKNKRHIAYLNEVYVHTDLRRKGVASKLVKHLIDKAKENPLLEQLHLRVNSQNSGAISFYEKLGFEKVTVLKDAVKNPDNTYQDEYFYCFYIKS